MTSPISLLLPINGTEPVAQPAPAADPALFTAALVAALQAAMVPAPPAPAVAVKPEAQPGDVSASDEEAPTSNGEDSTAVPVPSRPAATTAAPAGELPPSGTAQRKPDAAITPPMPTEPVVPGGSMAPVPPAADGSGPEPVASLGEAASPEAGAGSTADRSALPSPQASHGVAVPQVSPELTPPPGDRNPRAAKPAPTGMGTGRDGGGHAPSTAIRVTEGEILIATAAIAMRDSRAMSRPGGNQGTHTDETGMASRESVSRDAQRVTPGGSRPTRAIAAVLVLPAPVTVVAATEITPAPRVEAAAPAAVDVPVAGGPSAPPVDNPAMPVSVPAASRGAAAAGTARAREGDASRMMTAPGGRVNRRKEERRDEAGTSRAEGERPITPVPSGVTVPVPAASAPAPTATDPVPSSPEGTNTTPPAPAPEPAGSASESGSVSTEARGPRTAVASSGEAMAFVQELSDLLGEAEITSLTMSLGGGARRAGGRAASAVAASVTSGRAEVPPQVELHASVTDDDRIVMPGRGTTQPVLSGTPLGARERAVAERPRSPGGRTSTPIADPSPGIRPSAQPVTAETVSVRLAQPAPQRSVPDELPSPTSARTRASAAASAPKVPADRQELPAPSTSEDRTINRTRDPDESTASAPSDSQGRASMSAPGQSETPTRDEARPREGTSGEARNLREGVETQERPAGLADRVTLQVADADGRQTRIRVSVLGDQVRAVIVPSDQDTANHLERRMDDLQAALVRQGFSDSKVTVQSTASSTGTPWAAAAGGTTAEHAPTRSMDQPAGDQRQGSGNREQDRQGEGQRHPHQRSRERDPDDRQNQDA